MNRALLQGSLALLLLAAYLALGQVYSAQAGPLAQIPTVAIPTVTGTPVGAMATVKDNEQGYAYVRSGPNTVGYEIIGSLVELSVVPALGRSIGGDWIQVSYPGVPTGVGWVWVDLVDVTGPLPIIEPPPTSTPATTPTIDPTLAAQFIVEVTPTRLPTYTAPPPLSIPTFPPQTAASPVGRVPMGFIIVGMMVVGTFGLLISFLRGR